MIERGSGKKKKKPFFNKSIVVGLLGHHSHLLGCGLIWSLQLASFMGTSEHLCSYSVMVVSGPNQEESMGSQHQDHFLNME